MPLPSGFVRSQKETDPRDHVVMLIGFHASHEQFSPSRLLHCAQRAEEVGFAAAMCSDHFLPWSERQEHSGFAWSWLGAALQATKLSFGVVCAPGQRYHPAVIAQAAATLAEMYPNRFWLAVGSGENLNEHITGEHWPAKEDRNARLTECVAIIRALWAGKTVTQQGQVHVQEARLFTRPAQPPRIIGAAITPETAHWMGSWADGLITVGHEPEVVRHTVEAFRAEGGIGKPILLQAVFSYAPSEEEAAREAHHQWRHCVLPGDQLADLATPSAFDAACHSATVEEVRNRLVVSSDLDWYIHWLRELSTTGVDAVYLHHIGRSLERFIDVFGESVLPRV